jgi:hypothetical protein
VHEVLFLFALLRPEKHMHLEGGGRGTLEPTLLFSEQSEIREIKTKIRTEMALLCQL